MCIRDCTGGSTSGAAAGARAAGTGGSTSGAAAGARTAGTGGRTAGACTGRGISGTCVGAGTGGETAGTAAGACIQTWSAQVLHLLRQPSGAGGFILQ